MIGIPLRVEIGPRDVEQRSVVLVRRDTGDKESVAFKDIGRIVSERLTDIQKNLYDRALKFREENTYSIDDYDDFAEILNGKGGFVMSHWCGGENCEFKVKDDCKANIRNIPFDSPKETGQCIVCSGKSEKRVVWARAY